MVNNILLKGQVISIQWYINSLFIYIGLFLEW